MSESDATNAEPETEPELPLPPASLEFLIFSFKTQAEIQLGLIHFGDEKDRPKPNLPLAQHSIDMLGILHEKTKGNLNLDEQRLLENSLTELRFRYIEALKKSQ